MAPELKSYEGLNLVDFIVLPHFGEEEFKEGYQKMENEIEKLPYKVFKLNNKQAVLVRGEEVKIIG